MGILHSLDKIIGMGVLNLKEMIHHFFNKMILSKTLVKKYTIYIFHHF